MSEKDRRRLRKELDKEPYKKEIDDGDYGEVPADDAELRDGVPGPQWHRCYYHWGAIGMWMRLKRLPEQVAIVDLAYASGFLHEAAYRRLLESLGRRSERRQYTKLPFWDRDAKTLHFEGTLVRSIRSLTVAKNVVTLLDRFQECNWLKIADPLDSGQQVLKDAIYSLNKRLKKIDFHVCDDGQSVSWSRRRPSSHRRATSVRRPGNRR